ncbi:MAG: ABC transporter permease, partial [Desulfobacterales bacterium]|nr:ABC transporter permease [Desulfobacterales bacterium]
YLGRDMLSNIIYGARISMIVGLSAAILATINSSIIGILCGYIGGKFDLAVQRLVDIWMGVPQIILLIIIMSIIGPGIWQVIVVLGVSWGIIGSRIVRGAVIGIKENVYVEAANAIGCSTTRILTRHILPNIMAPTIILFTVRVANAILTEAALSFLGFGIPPPTPSWGGMLSGSGRAYMFQAPWMVVWPGLALSIVVFGVNMFGDALRDILDPRLRGGVGRYGATVKKEAGKAGPAG